MLETAALIAATLVVATLLGIVAGLAGRRLPKPADGKDTAADAKAPSEMPAGPDGCRLVRIPAGALCDAWPAIAAHAEQLPRSGELMRDVAQERASLWAMHDANADFDVRGLAVVGVSGGAVSVRAATMGFLARWSDFARVAICAEAHRVQCFRVACDIAPADARRAYEFALRSGVFRPPLGGGETNVGVH